MKLFRRKTKRPLPPESPLHFQLLATQTRYLIEKTDTLNDRLTLLEERFKRMSEQGLVSVRTVPGKIA